MGVILDVQGRLFNSETLPQRTPDNGTTGNVLARGNKYGEQVVQPSTLSKHMLAVEGTYWVTPGSTTPGTKLALGAATTAFSDTAGILYLVNQAPFMGPKTYVDYIKLIGLLAHTTSSDALYFAIVVDVIRNPTTDNTALLTPVSPYGDIGGYSGLLTVKAQSNATSSAFPASNAATKRVVAQGAFPRLVGVLGDSVKFIFGAWDAGEAVQSTQASPTTPGLLVVNCPPLVLGAKQSAILHLWQPGNTIAPQAIFEMGHFER